MRIRSLALLNTVVAVGIVSALEPTPSAAQDAVDSVLERAGIYATQFRRQLSNLVAEETYVQDMRVPMGTINTAGTHGEPVRHRELKSDLLMIRPAERYVEFRDVFEIDGRAVRDRQNRLTELFLSSKGTNTEQAEKIAQESARFNIGNVYRNFNTPTLALIFLEPETRARFRFRKVDATRPPTLAKEWKLPTFDSAQGTDVWAIEYREVRPKTIIGRFGGGDMPSSGRFWIEAPTGRVLASELVVGDPMMQCTINVRFGGEAIGGLSVPSEMRERYINNRDRIVTTGTATYGRVRRFGVATDEDIPVPDSKKR